MSPSPQRWQASLRTSCNYLILGSSGWARGTWSNRNIETKKMENKQDLRQNNDIFLNCEMESLKHNSHFRRNNFPHRHLPFSSDIDFFVVSVGPQREHLVSTKTSVRRTCCTTKYLWRMSCFSEQNYSRTEVSQNTLILFQKIIHHSLSIIEHPSSIIYHLSSIIHHLSFIIIHYSSLT